MTYEQFQAEVIQSLGENWKDEYKFGFKQVCNQWYEFSVPKLWDIYTYKDGVWIFGCRGVYGKGSSLAEAEANEEQQYNATFGNFVMSNN